MTPEERDDLLDAYEERGREIQRLRVDVILARGHQHNLQLALKQAEARLAKVVEILTDASDVPTDVDVTWPTWAVRCIERALAAAQPKEKSQ